MLQNYITVFNEYPGKNTHGVLRAQTKTSDTADELRKKAKLFFSARKNSLTLGLSSHHQTSFRFLTISFNFLKLNVPKYSRMWQKKNCTGPVRGFSCFLGAEARELVMLHFPPCVPTYQPRPPFCLLDTTVISSLTTPKM